MLDTGWLIGDAYEQRYHDPFWLWDSHRTARFPQKNPLHKSTSKINENDELRVEIGLRRLRLKKKLKSHGLSFGFQVTERKQNLRTWEFPTRPTHLKKT